MKMGVEHWRNDTERRKPQALRGILFQGYLFPPEISHRIA
jgi:hypothetical protein